MKLLPRRRMSTYVGPKRTRVAVDPKRRARGQKAVERMRDWHNKQTHRCPVGSHDSHGQGVTWLGHCAHSVACAYGKSASGWNAAAGWFATPERFRRTGKKSKN